MTIRSAVYTPGGSDDEHDEDRGDSWEQQPAVNLRLHFSLWLREMEKGDAAGGNHWHAQFEELRDILVDRAPEFDKQTFILKSAMKLGNIEQAKQLWPEIDYALYDYHWKIELAHLHEKKSADQMNDISGADADAIAVAGFMKHVDALVSETEQGETGGNEPQTGIPEEHRTESMTIKVRAAKYFGKVDWTTDHKAKVLRQMMDNGDIRFEQINPPNGRRWYFDKRDI